MAEKQLIGKVKHYTVTYRPHIGSGGFGTVYKALNDKTSQLVAAKEMLTSAGNRSSAAMIEMAEREISVIKSLKGHKNVVQLIEHFSLSESFWIFMEYCDLGDLREYLGKKYLSFIDKITMMQQAASAIAFMHSQNPPLVHRDIKLENLLMKKEGETDILKVTDFGLTKLYNDRLNSTFSAAFQPGKEMTTLCGTPLFMAPEFSADLEHGLKYEPSVDVFALGLVFLVVLEQERPDFLPLSVESKRRKIFICIGQEMVKAYRENKPLPTVVESNKSDDRQTKRLKRIITNMTKFRCVHRKNIQEVNEELNEIVDFLRSDEEHSASGKRSSVLDALKDYQIERRSIHMIKKIETGTFGDMWEANMDGKQKVAVRTFKAEKPADVESCYNDAMVMHKLCQGNIAALLGVCFMDEPMYIITEYTEHGSLLMYLRKEEHEIMFQSRVAMAAQIANGMSFLELNNYVHRNVRAASMLVYQNDVIKVADFTLTVQLKDGEFIETQEKKFPIKWTSPEAAYDKCFTVKSDVWAYAILLYELLTNGRVPYPGMKGHEVLDKTYKGYRMPKSDFQTACPDPIYNLMLKCWEKFPRNRPTFGYLQNYFDKYIVTEKL